MTAPDPKHESGPGPSPQPATLHARPDPDARQFEPEDRLRPTQPVRALREQLAAERGVRAGDLAPSVDRHHPVSSGLPAGATTNDHDADGITDPAEADFDTAPLAVDSGQQQVIAEVGSHCPRRIVRFQHVAEWPRLDPRALHGLAGEFVNMIDPHTEADPTALLVSFLVAFGSAVSAGPYIVADGARHFPRLFAVLVGRTSRARKGTSWRHVRNVMELVDQGWATTRVLGGLSSGEGLIAAVGDGEEDNKGNLVGAVIDKRLLVIEEEFARVLTVKGRDSNTLSAVVRQAWDSGDLRTMTKKPLSATGAHISVLGHITVEELRRTLTATDRANGFANRFLIACVRRSKTLPDGGNLSDREVELFGRRVRGALDAARKIGRVRRSADAARRWAQLYSELVDDDPGGLVGAITDRAEAQVLRLSLVYALLDGSQVVEVVHLDAAEAVWRSCAQSVHYIFGESLGDEVADQLLAAIRKRGSNGMDGTEQRDFFGRHQSGERLHDVRKQLEQRGLIETHEEQTDGRPRLISVATEAIKATEGSGGRGLWSPGSPSSQSRVGSCRVCGERVADGAHVHAGCEETF